ncbi:MAG TPA: ABC transporter permease [Bryobacteraceae bacterium]|nr:ABC transporter permease [Bryobacteraceae bacterium]
METFQDFLVLSVRAVRNIFRSPHYVDDIFQQMDVIGVGSLPIVMLIGLFSGVVMTMQMARALQQYGAQGQVGQIVSIALVRELGPVLTAVLVAGRNASGIASELGSMKVTEQIDAMRALGTDPIQKLVTPRLIATAFVLPLLTIIADFIGLIGGAVIAYALLNISLTQYWTSAWMILQYNDLVQGLLKPFIFALVIALVGCFYGMRTTGGTQGVGRATTKAVVVSSVWIFFLTSMITRFFLYYS